MALFWSMVVDDATANSHQNPKETQHRNNMKANANDTRETLSSGMLKNVGTIHKSRIGSGFP